MFLALQVGAPQVCSITRAGLCRAGEVSAEAVEAMKDRAARQLTHMPTTVISRPAAERVYQHVKGAFPSALPLLKIRSYLCVPGKAEFARVQLLQWSFMCKCTTARTKRRCLPSIPYVHTYNGIQPILTPIVQAVC